MSSISSTVSRSQILEKNRIYDRAGDQLWHLLVYGPVHGGSEFTNIGGVRILDFIGRHIKRDSVTRLLELCCGLGETCLYLASNFPCFVTGVDMNEHQIRNAREKLSRINPQVAARVRFVQEDILKWQPAESYDLIYAIDSLALVDDLPTVFRKAHQALRPGGRLILAEILAGPRITKKIRNLVWELDGFINLPGTRRYHTLLREAGFDRIDSQDLTDAAKACFQTILKAVRMQEGAVIALAGRRGLQSWTAVGQLYTGFFSCRQLLYKRISALRS